VSFGPNCVLARPLMILVTATSRASRLPSVQSADLSFDQYYPSSAISQTNATFGPDAKSSRPNLHHNSNQPPGRGPIPKFQKIKSIQELRPRVNSQPLYRRANPEGGFISVSCNPKQAFSPNLTDTIPSAIASSDHPSSCHVPDM
jgi:dual specificity protein kinase YAK1